MKTYFVRAIVALLLLSPISANAEGLKRKDYIDLVWTGFEVLAGAAVLTHATEAVGVLDEDVLPIALSAAGGVAIGCGLSGLFFGDKVVLKDERTGLVLVERGGPGNGKYQFAIYDQKTLAARNRRSACGYVRNPKVSGAEEKSLALLAENENEAKSLFQNIATASPAR